MVIDPTSPKEVLVVELDYKTSIRMYDNAAVEIVTCCDVADIPYNKIDDVIALLREASIRGSA